MKTTTVPSFNKKISFRDWVQEKFSEIEERRERPDVSTEELTNLAIKIFECTLKNFHLFRNGRSCNYDPECLRNQFIYASFRRLVFLRREQAKKEFFEDIDSIIEGFIEKNTDLLSTYVSSINTEEEIFKACKYYKKYCNKVSSSTTLIMEDFMRHNFNGDFSKCIRVYSSLGEDTPEYIIEKIDRWWAATKIKRWFRNIIHQPSVYPAAERIVWRSVVKDGLDHIFTESKSKTEKSKKL